MYVCMIPEDWSFVIDFEKIVYVVQLGPKPNLKPKPWFWTKANTKVTFNTTHNHNHPPPTQTFGPVTGIIVS